MRRAVLLAVVGVVVLFYSSPAPAQVSTEAVAGTTIKVNTKADELNTDGDCTLREAIKAANKNTRVDGCTAGSSTEQDAIHFALGNQARITLGSILPDITDRSGLSIDGQKAKITVNGNDKRWVFFVVRGAKLALLHLTVANARKSGLLNNNGQVEVSNSTFSGNRGFEGGGIANFIGTLTVRNSTFSDNSADTAGGGISNTGTLKVSNSTFSGNLARGSEPPRLSSFSGGGGIANVFGTVTVSNSTFSKNGARIGPGGIRNDRGKVTLKNTIVANSTKGKNCSTRIMDGGFNIDDGTSCHFRTAKNSLPSTNPKLASSLENNGGPTKTIMLLKRSPAINAIPQATNGCGTQITTDQRGVKRPQGKGCDIGAFEKRQ